MKIATILLVIGQNNVRAALLTGYTCACSLTILLQEDQVEIFTNIRLGHCDLIAFFVLRSFTVDLGLTPSLSEYYLPAIFGMHTYQLLRAIFV